MVDFSNIKKADVSEASLVKYELSQLEGDMCLTLAPATDANKAYLNAVLKRSKMLSRGKVNNVTADMIIENRNNDKKLYAEHIIKEWNVVDVNGAEVEFNKENVSAFLDALPNYIFDEIRIFAANPVNFTNGSVNIEDETKN